MFSATHVTGLEYVLSADGLSMFATLSLGGGGGGRGLMGGGGGRGTPQFTRENAGGNMETNSRSLSPWAKTMQNNARQGNIFQCNVILIQCSALPYSSVEP